MSESYEQKLARKAWNDRHKFECVCDECVPPIADELATLRADNESLRRRVEELTSAGNGVHEVLLDMCQGAVSLKRIQAAMKVMHAAMQSPPH